MFVDRTRLLVNNIKKLLRRGANDHIRKIISKTHAADLAGVFQFLSAIEQQAFFDLFETTERKALLFSELEDEIILRLIKDMPAEKIVNIFEKMDNDDVADLLGKISSERAKALLSLFADESAEAVEMLLGYDPKTAGGIMIADFIALKEDISVKQATEILQKDYTDIEMPLYLYVVSDHGYLIGVISLRKLVVVPPETKLKSIMDTEVLKPRLSLKASVNGCRGFSLVGSGVLLPATLSATSSPVCTKWFIWQALCRSLWAWAATLVRRLPPVS